jgi:choline dehydrogenase
METSALGPSAYRGADGPLRVTIPDCKNPLFQAFLQAGQQAGYAYTEDVNGYRQEGFYRMERSTFGGVRSSAARRYLHPARRRGNIDLKIKVRVARILFDGRRASGVAFVENGQKREVRGGEIILSAGAINSPQLLKLSGVGPRPELQALDIPVVADLPGVGENLQDHLDFLVQYRCTKPVSFYPATKRLNQVGIGLEWLLFKRGIGVSNIWEAGSFFRSRPGIEFPNLQHHFAPVAISYDGAEKIDGHGFQIHLSQMRPRSRGHVRLASRDPFASPRLLFNQLADAEDRAEVRDGIRLTREVVAQAAFDEFRGAEIAPGAAVDSDAELDAFARRKAETSHHPSCTCRMGSDDMAVVDDEGRVHGLEGLRVVDASIMPTVVSSNINAPTLMMAEKIADRVRGRPPMPPEPVAYYRAENFRTAQR